MNELLFKVLGPNGQPHNGGSGTWHLPKGKRPGKWMPKIENLELCERGYHLCRPNDLLRWLGPEVYVAEYKGERQDSGNKIVVGQARLIYKVDTWNDRTARLFAADCAEHVLPIYEQRHPNDDRPRKAVEAARLFANGQITAEELDAAGAAARDAARAAAWDAAWAAAWAAAWDAARAADRDAAWDAAWDAARAAARDAAWDAAWDAERQWLTKRLFEYLEIDIENTHE